MSQPDDLPPGASPEERALQRTQKVATLLDDSIPLPGTNYRIGIDPIIGVLPISGDLVTGLIGLYIAAEAALVGVPPAIIARMFTNIIVDIAVGSVPILGTVFDAVWKANVKNVELFEDHLENTR